MSDTIRALRKPCETEIRVVGVHKAFHGRAVLRGVDLRIKRGEMVAVVGGSGCGKTVLLDHILGAHAPERGRIEVIDHSRADRRLVDIAQAGREQLDAIHRHWGVVFQHNALFSGSVYDNLALWLDEVRHLERGDIEPIARRVLGSVGLPFDAQFLALDHEQLSGGMAKRLAVARALSMAPRVLFYDEPTTGLDPASAGQIQDLLDETHRDTGAGGPRTTVMITHDKDLLSRLQPRTVMLHEGQVRFDGSYEAFIASDSPIARPYHELMPLLHERSQRAVAMAGRS